MKIITSTIKSNLKTNLHNPILRWCVYGKQQEKLCTEMIESPLKLNLDNFSCVVGRHVFQCLEFISKNKADIINIDAERLYIGGRYFGLKPILAERVDHTGIFTDDAVLVVRRLPYFAEGKKRSST